MNRHLGPTKFPRGAWTRPGWFPPLAAKSCAQEIRKESREDKKQVWESCGELMSHALIWKADGKTRGVKEALGKRGRIHSNFSDSPWMLGVKRDHKTLEDEEEGAEQLNG